MKSSLTKFIHLIVQRNTRPAETVAYKKEGEDIPPALQHDQAVQVERCSLFAEWPPNKVNYRRPLEFRIRRRDIQTHPMQTHYDKFGLCYAPNALQNSERENSKGISDLDRLHSLILNRRLLRSIAIYQPQSFNVCICGLRHLRIRVLIKCNSFEI